MFSRRLKRFKDNTIIYEKESRRHPEDLWKKRISYILCLMSYIYIYIYIYIYR